MGIQFYLSYGHLKAFMDNLLHILVTYPGNHAYLMSIDFLYSV